MVKEAIALSQSIIAELKDKGFCKLQITIEAVREQPVSDGLDAFCALGAYILDEALLARVIHACHCCTTARDVTDRVLFLLKQSAVWDGRIMTSTPFLESLIPHLVNLPQKPSARQIYRWVYERL